MMRDLKDDIYEWEKTLKTTLEFIQQDKDMQYGTLIRNSDCFQHFGMHCGLTRDETRKLAYIFQKLGWLQLEKHGWKILKLDEPKQMAR